MSHEFPDEMTCHPPLSDDDRRLLRSIQDRCMSMIRELDPAKAKQIEDFYTDPRPSSDKSIWTIYAPTQVRAFTYSGSKVLISRQRGVRVQNRVHTVLSYYRSGNEKKLTAKYTVKGVSWRKAKKLLRKNVELHQGSVQTEIVFKPPRAIDYVEMKFGLPDAPWTFKGTETGRISRKEPILPVAEPKINNTKGPHCPICEWEKSKGL